MSNFTTCEQITTLTPSIMRKIYCIILALASLLIYSCSKDDNTPSVPNPKPIEAPTSIAVTKGNNQVGFKGHVLLDTICIEIVPKNMNDTANYFYKVDSWNAQIAKIVRLSDRIVLNITWALSPDKTSHTFVMSLFSTSNKDQNGIYTPIASVEVNASAKEPWSKIFTDTGNTIGPGEFLDIHFYDDLNGIVFGDYFNGNAKTTDGGKTWSFISKFRSDQYQVSFYDKMHGFVIVTNNWAYFTNDGGQTFYETDWTAPHVGHLFIMDYHMLTKDIILGVGVNGIIMKSINAGKTWEKYEGFSFVNFLYSIACINDNTYYACGQVGKIVKTTNGGQSWTETDLPLNNDLRKIYFLNENVGFAGGTYGTLVKTTNGGDSWSTIRTGLRFPIMEIHFFNSSLGYIVTTAGEIAKTTNAGETWELICVGSYGVSDLTKVYFKDTETLLGIQQHSIYKFDL